MALSLTFLQDDFDQWGKHQRLVYDAVGDASYPAGGYPLDRDAIQAGNVRGARVIGANAAGATLLAVWDHVTEKLRVYYPSGGAAASPAALADPVQGVPTVDNHAAAQTVTARLAGANTLTTWTDATGLSDTPALVHAVSAAGSGIPGVGKEVLATTDLSTCQWRLEVIAN